MASVGASASGGAGGRVWLEAARPRTWPAAVAPILVGSALAAREGVLDPALAACALATALALQIGANLANDVADHARGADGPDRTGPRRATASGLIPAEAMMRATAAVFAVAAVLGLVLVARGGWPLALAGAASVAAAAAYTLGPWPLAYHGLGDLAVFVFFGLVGVVGSYYVHALAVTPAAVALAVPVGALATAILVVNNLRDRAPDARVGKRTLAVRLGDRRTRAYYAVLVLGAYAWVGLAWALGAVPGGALLAGLSLPLALRGVARVAREDGPALNACLAATAQLLAVFAGLLALGLVV